MKIKYMSLALGLFLFATSAWSANVAVKVSPADLAEHVYFSFSGKATLKEVAESSEMTTKHKQEARAYLRGHALSSEKVPRMTWVSGSSVITVGSEKIDFSLIEKKQLLVNGKIISIPKDFIFSEVARKIQTSLETPKGKTLFKLPFELISSAQAASSFGEYFLGAMSYVLGIDQGEACNSSEAVRHASCVFKSEASAIQASIREYETITNFNCVGKKFDSIIVNYGTPSAPRRGTTSVAYDEKGNIKTLSYHRNDQLDCQMSLVDGKFDSLTYSSDSSGWVCGHSNGEGGNKFEKGDKVKSVIVGGDFSLARLQKCCASDSCKVEMNEYIANGRLSAPENKDNIRNSIAQ
ncbi:hypothetical protein [Bdellovibrio sp. HCB337]|uniref:hypothetical protein n=1 Tax=Bdellovibrio sp. HCB337 TaxID=3394358 RepID=UPI0039A56072